MRTIRSCFAPASNSTRALLLAASAVLCACNDDTQHLDPLSVAMVNDGTLTPVYDDNELTIYEAKTSLLLPIKAPAPAQLDALENPTTDTDPFARAPWVQQSDVQIQVTWTLSNLDDDDHDVWLMLDPWNEFGRYEPAIHMDGDRAVRDLSGIDMLFLVPGVKSKNKGDTGSRVVGTITFDDMDELALDFATVFKILKDAAPVENADGTEDDPRSRLVNNAFNVRDRTYNSPLLAPYRPLVVPGLVGFDYGVRTSEPANVAVEIVVELRDREQRVARGGQTTDLLAAPGDVITVGGP
jgi:hypothetical protein